MIAFLVEPLDYEFFRRGLLAALMIGTLCGLIGVFVVLRGMSYIGHGLSHAAIGGAVVGITLNLNFYVGTLVILSAVITYPLLKRRFDKTVLID